MVTDDPTASAPQPEPTAPDPQSTAAPPAAAPRSRRGGRKVLLVVAIVLGFLVVVGGGTAFLVYSKATEIDRSNPEVVVSQFLRAALVDRDANHLSLFVCRQWSAQDAMQVAAPPAGDAVTASWHDYATQVMGERATVTVTVEFFRGTGALSGGSMKTWQFALEDQGGWRVCDVNKS